MEADAGNGVTTDKTTPSSGPRSPRQQSGETIVAIALSGLQAVQITEVTLDLCHLPPGAGPLAGCGGKAIPDLLPGGSQDGTMVYLIGNLSSLQILVATIAFLLPSAEYSSVETDKKVSGPSARFCPGFVFLKT